MKTILIVILISLSSIACQSNNNENLWEENKLLKERIVFLESQKDIKLKEFMKIDWDKAFKEFDKLNIKEQEYRIQDMRLNRLNREKAIDSMIRSKFNTHISPGPNVKDVDLFFKNHELSQKFILEVYLQRLQDTKYKLIKPQ